MVIQLPASTTLAHAHDVAHSVQDRVRAEVSNVREVMVEPAPTADVARSTSEA
jgi:divalent metal cation (Fe/Co/Zn/Cd) transporter